MIEDVQEWLPKLDTFHIKWAKVILLNALSFQNPIID